MFEGAGTAYRPPGYPWSGLEQCGGLGQPTCYEYGGGHTVQLTPTAYKLQVVVDSSSVTSGSTVRFTARRSDGRTFTVQSWTWRPLTPVTPPPIITLASKRRGGATMGHERLASADDPAEFGPEATGCGLTPTCDVVLTHNDAWVATPQRGYMYVQATVDGVVETARAAVTVIPRSHEVTVQCDPAFVLRTSVVQCAARVTPDDPYTVVHLKSVGYGEVIVDDEIFQQMPAGEPAVWAGVAVRPTTVTISVMAGGVRLSSSTSFDIAPRIDRPEFPQWARRQWPAEPPTAQPAMGPPYLTQSYPGIIVTDEGYLIPRGAAGYTYHQYPFAAEIRRVGAGPNLGIAFVEKIDWISIGQAAGIYVAASLFPGDPFYQRQTGGDGYCGPAEMDQLRAAVIDHENRHYTTFLSQTRPFDVEAQFEATTVLTDLTQPLGAQTGPFKTLTDQFDNLVQLGDLWVEENHPIQPNAPNCTMRP